MGVESVVGLVVAAYGAASSRSAADKAEKKAKQQANKSYAASQQSTRSQLALAEVQYELAKAEGIMSDAMAVTAAADAIAEGVRVREENIKVAKQQQLSYIKNGIEIAGTPAMVIAKTRLDGEREAEAYANRADNETRLGKLRKIILLNNAYARKVSAGMDATATMTAAEIARTGIYNTAEAYTDNTTTNAWTSVLTAATNAYTSNVGNG